MVYEVVQVELRKNLLKNRGDVLGRLKYTAFSGFQTGRGTPPPR